MADKWVSNRREWCRYCRIYVYNNKLSLANHEKSDIHKERVRQYIGNVHKKAQQDKKAQESARREVQRIEKVAQAKYNTSDVPLGAPSLPSRAKSSVVSQPPSARKDNRRSSSSSPLPPPPTDPPIHEGPAREGRNEWAMPSIVAAPGEWEVVEPKKVEPAPEAPKKETTDTLHDQAPEFQEDEEDDEDLRNFKIKEKELPIDSLKEPSEDNQEEVTFKKRKRRATGRKVL